MKSPLSMSRALGLFAATAVLFITASAQAAVAWPTIQQGATGENVYTLQAMLRQAGYSSVPYSGTFDTATNNGVKAYQTANGLSSDGIVGTNTWESITSRSTSLAQPGNFSGVVNALQRQLKNRYGYSVTIDSDFGPTTTTKAKSFQKGVNLTADGVVGRNTWFHVISGDTVRIRHSTALSQLNGAGISVVSSGSVTSDRSINPSTSLEQMRQNTVNGLIAFKNATGCSITVTGGTENYVHAGGTQSHWTGYKIDIGVTSCVSNYITGNFTYIGVRSDGANMYRDGGGNIYARESDHWDILYQ